MHSGAPFDSRFRTDRVPSLWFRRRLNEDRRGVITRNLCSEMKVKRARCGHETLQPLPYRDKTAELSQRRPRGAPNIWVPWKISRVLTIYAVTPTATFPKICNGLLFRLILRMCVQSLKFVALPVPEIVGGTEKISAILGYAHAPFSRKF